MTPAWQRLSRYGVFGLASLLLINMCATPVRGESVGSPSGILEKGQWLFGLDADGWNRDLRLSGSDTQKVSVLSSSHFRGYGLTEWLTLYAKVGVAFLRAKDPGIANPDAKASFGGNLVLGTGMKARLWHNARRDWEWDATTQYLWLGAPHKRHNNQGFWQEWQLATTIAKSFGRWKPYAGVKPSLVRMRFTRRVGSTFIKSGTYHQNNFLGPVIGTDIYFGKDRKTVLNLETSYLDGPEISLALSVLF